MRAVSRAIGLVGVIGSAPSAYGIRLGEEEGLDLELEQAQAQTHHVAHFVQRIETSPQEMQKFETAPAGTAQSLFVPAKHICDKKKLEAYQKQFPSQAKKTEKQQKIQNALANVNDALHEVGLPTILEGGSTLGFYRNCGVIPSDADGDIALLGHWLDDDKIADIEKAIQKRNGTLGKSMCPKGPQYTGCEMRSSFEDGSYVDLLVYATQEKCDTAPCKFFSPLWPGGEVGDVFAPCTTGDVHFEQAIFLDRTFWLQAPTSQYLSLEYGPKWKDPDSWGKAKDCGIYRNCNFKKKEQPKEDSFAQTIPPASYVLSLQPKDVRKLSLLEEADTKEEKREQRQAAKASNTASDEAEKTLAELNAKTLAASLQKLMKSNHNH